MIKHPHPSGRPIRIERKPRYCMSPPLSHLEGPLIPKLRINRLPTTDAIGYLKMPEQEEGSPWSVGFINFKETKC